MKTKTETLAEAWKERNQLRAIAKELRAHAVNLLSDADELQANAASTWAEALSKTGNMNFTYKYVQEKEDMEYHLETGEVFRP